MSALTTARLAVLHAIAGGLGDTGQLDVLQAELTVLKLGALSKRAAATEGIAGSAVEAALDEDDPKAALIRIMMEHHLKVCTMADEAAPSDSDATGDAEDTGRSVPSAYFDKRARKADDCEDLFLTTIKCLGGRDELEEEDADTSLAPLLYDKALMNCVTMGVSALTTEHYYVRAPHIR